MAIKLSTNNIFQYLLSWGLCQQQDLELVGVDILRATRIEIEDSSNFLVRIPGIFHLAVKQYHHHDSDCDINKVLNEWQLNKFLQSRPGLDYSTSLILEIILYDRSNSILVYKYPKNYFSLQEYYLNSKVFSTKIPEVIGITLASFHRETMDDQECCNFLNKSFKGKSNYVFPYPLYLRDRITPETFFISPSESIKFLKLYQSSEILKSTVTKLITNHNHYCLTNNTPVIDNILIPMDWENLLCQNEQFDNSSIKIINWDNCSWGDPASDLGTVIAGYFLLWLNSLFLHPAIELEKSLQLAVIPLEVIQTSILALVRAYISRSPKIVRDDPLFLERIVQFTGLALIYKVITTINLFEGFNNQGVFTLQLAKTMLCTPKKSFKYVFPNLKDSGATK